MLLPLRLPACTHRGAVLAESGTPAYSVYGLVLFMGSSMLEGARVVASQLLLGPYKWVPFAHTCVNSFCLHL